MSKEIVEYLASQIKKGITEVKEDSDGRQRSSGDYRKFRFNVTLPIETKCGSKVESCLHCIVSGSVNIDGEHVELSSKQESYLLSLCVYQNELQTQEKCDIIAKGLKEVSKEKK